MLGVILARVYRSEFALRPLTKLRSITAVYNENARRKESVAVLSKPSGL